MSNSKRPVPATLAEVKRMVCALNDTMNAKAHDALIANIVGTGASIAEVLEAYAWLMPDNERAMDGEPSPAGRVGLVYEILARRRTAANEDSYDSRSTAAARFGTMASGF